MKNIYLKKVNKSFEGEPVLENINLTVPEGKFFALLGPSGCGKTTILRLIAGFEKPDSGTISLGDTNITDIPSNKRKINTVFQNYALFPHMNVFENVAYGLRLKNLEQSIVKNRVQKILKTVRLEHQMYKPIHQLSGGQQQRVALARAIINEPEVLLLDEPLAALDVKLREHMLIELIDLQETIKTTFVYITHDQTEALTVADKMAIMNHDGEIEQIGTPQEIYEFPVSSFVAQFVGKTNLFRGTLRIHGDVPTVDVSDLGRFSVFISAKCEWMVEDRPVLLGVRPEKIWISKKPVEGFSNHVIGKVESIVYHGPATQYNVRLKNDQKVQVFEQNEEHFAKDKIDYDDEVHLYWQKENAMVLEK
ncbi:MAG: spermidine/putrescine transport system ATP-binding protein [Alteromonas naphthalenivorans]|jgi:spermidine/putrescine transport system ATP-binding protein